MMVPCMVYRRGGKPGQVDVPGNDYKIVDTVEAFEAALAEGWQATPVLSGGLSHPEPVQAPPVVIEPRRGRRPVIETH